MNSDGCNVERFTDSPRYDFPHDWKTYGPADVSDLNEKTPAKFFLHNNYHKQVLLI